MDPDENKQIYFPNIEYKMLIEIIGNFNCDLHKEKDIPEDCIKNINEALNYISQPLQEKIYNHYVYGLLLKNSLVPTEDAWEDIRRLVTERENVCARKFRDELYAKCYMNAYRELINCIEDDGRYKDKKYISEHECLLFIDLLESFIRVVSNQQQL